MKIGYMKKWLWEILLILCINLALVGCSNPVELKFDGQHYYQIVNHQLIAFDGSNWFQLRQAEQDLGVVNGASITVAEQWLKLGMNSSHIETYMRSLATRNNTNLQPVFVRFN